jgi:HlyD family secretion protein
MPRHFLPMPSMMSFRPTRLALFALPFLAAACQKKEGKQSVPVETAVASRQRVLVDVQATGVITPVQTVEVRSKASGLIVDMPVVTGTAVTPGQLLLRIDPRDAQNRFDQAKAALTAAEANVEVTRTQLERSKELASRGVITQPEFEQARVAFANAESQVAAARTQLELARIALEDVTIRSPVRGTVIGKSVSEGQVIASATNSASGGTILMQIADLGVVYDSTLVNESDIGKVRPGQVASVTVDAYPGRVFRGVVEKIEPRATVQQSVTMFPVLIRLDNADGALMPGMNSDVQILIEQRDDVLAVPVDAIRSMSEIPSVAAALGADAQALRATLEAQRDSLLAGDTPRGAPADGATGAGRPPGAGSAGGDTPRRARRSGGQRPAGAGAGGGGMRGGSGGGFGGGASSLGIVVMKKGPTLTPRLVRMGIGNYEVTEVTRGLAEGDTVAIISAALLQLERDRMQERIRSRTSLPGMSGGGGGGGSGGTRRGTGS